MHFGVDLFWPSYLVAALVLAAVAVHIHAYRRTGKPVSSGLKAILLGLRLAALALIVFVLWRPAAESETVLSRRAKLTLLVDSSRSMSIADERQGEETPVSRLARAGEVFSDNASLWREITDLYDVSGYSFARTLQPLPIPPAEIPTRPLFGVQPNGPATAIGDAIEQSRRMAAAGEVILIVSDGLSNSGADPLDAAAAGGAAIYAVSVGSSAAGPSTRDVAVRDVRSSEAFVGADTSVAATVLLSGLARRPVAVTLKVDGVAVETKTVSTPLDEALEEADFKFKPARAGPVRLEVSAEALPDEVVSVNNAAATFVDARMGRMRILYLDTFRPGVAFIRRAIQSAQDVDLRLLVPQGAEDKTLVDAAGEDWDIYIIGDVPAAGLPKTLVEKIVSAVEADGKAALFLGGDQALGRGGYAGTPLSRLVPFDIAANEKLDSGEFSLEPQPRGPAASIIEIGADKSTEVWRQLSPVMSVNIVGKPRAGAMVLLEGRPVRRDADTGAVATDPTRSAAPVLAVEEFGKGRTGALTAEGTWKWATGAGVEDKDLRDRSAAAFVTLWRQMAFWLARREERGGYTIGLNIPRHRVDTGEKIDMDASLLDPDLQRVTDATLTAEITSETGESFSRRFWIEGQDYRVDFEPPAPGDYHVQVTATRNGAQVATKESAFVAAGADIEFATLVARPSTLEALARSTGGRHAPAALAAEVLGDIRERAASARYVRVQRLEIWSSWWYAALVIVLLLAEWVLRKTAGLI